MTPAATLESAPCSARPIAREAAPSTAMIEVVRTPSCCRTATKPTTSTKFRAIEPAKVCKVTSGAPRRG